MHATSSTPRPAASPALTFGKTAPSAAVLFAAAILFAPRIATVATAADPVPAPVVTAPRQHTREELVELPADNVRDALDDPSRPVADRARDDAARIEALLRASGVARGMRVADLGAADGYLVQVLAYAVHRFGRTWANNDPASLDAGTAKAWAKRLESPSTADIARLDNPLTAPLPRYANQLDIVFSVGVYHDAVARAVDRGAMNSAVFAATASGGKYVVVDALAESGSLPEAAAAQCRSSQELVRKEVEAAGFRLATSSDALRATGRVTTTSACGEAAATSDRFLLVFEKPGG